MIDGFVVIYDLNSPTEVDGTIHTIGFMGYDPVVGTYFRNRLGIGRPAEKEVRPSLEKALLSAEKVRDMRSWPGADNVNFNTIRVVSYAEQITIEEIDPNVVGKAMQTLDIIETLKNRGDFLRAAKIGQKSVSASIIVQSIKNNLGIIRVGFTASKKVGNAVARNRAKRRMRSLIAEISLTVGYDYVLIARGGILNVDWDDLIKEVS